MKIKNLMIASVVIVTVLLSLSSFDCVAVTVNKNHNNYTGNLKGRQQTYIYLGDSPKPQVTMGVGQSLKIDGILSYDTPPTNWTDNSHGIPNATINIQSLNSDQKTWTTVATKLTAYEIVSAPSLGINNVSLIGDFFVTLTPSAAGTYTYRFTYDGDSQYAPAVSSTITLIVTNVVVS